jgi:hypothetical protein
LETEAEHLGADQKARRWTSLVSGGFGRRGHWLRLRGSLDLSQHFDGRQRQEPRPHVTRDLFFIQRSNRVLASASRFDEHAVRLTGDGKLGDFASGRRSSAALEFDVEQPEDLISLHPGAALHPQLDSI